MGGVLGTSGSTEQSVLVSKLEAKMVEAMRERALKGTSMKSFNSIILKFPKIDESLRKCKTIFQEFDEDSNGTIDKQELHHCFKKLEINFSEDETDDLFEACDMNEDMGINFNEFIVLICLVYLLKEPSAAQEMGFPDLQATFETLVNTFVFLDKNRDGYVSRTEMVQAINETTTGERSSGRIAMKRFG
ncbi:uncharacterized protein A4U43_C01F35140 [Asparagus officinalis]|uniref:EF-hand domain-containing protein n=1 Tax=Asparagus officinalis TaxID=4686 RepID=A0A5P1FVC6_ASPOF|nr:uncharacterized protein A4U43_C01F35140 [Asparagus officinalis]